MQKRSSDHPNKDDLNPPFIIVVATSSVSINIVVTHIRLSITFHFSAFWNMNLTKCSNKNARNTHAAMLTPIVEIVHSTGKVNPSWAESDMVDCQQNSIPETKLKSEVSRSSAGR